MVDSKFGGTRCPPWKAHYSGRYVEVGRSVARRRSNVSLGSVNGDGCVVQIFYDVAFVEDQPAAKETPVTSAKALVKAQLPLWGTGVGVSVDDRR